MSIRIFRNTDLPAIYEIYANSKLDELRFEEHEYELVPLNEDERRFSELKESDIYIYEEGNVVGYCASYGSEIRAIYVHSKERGKGIGKNMLEFLLSNLDGDVSLNVAKSNHPAKKLYGKYGFEVVNEFTTSYNGIEAIANKMVRKNNDYKFQNCRSLRSLGRAEKARPFERR